MNESFSEKSWAVSILVGRYSTTTVTLFYAVIIVLSKPKFMLYVSAFRVEEKSELTKQSFARAELNSWKNYPLSD